MALTLDQFIDETYHKMGDFCLTPDRLMRELNKKKQEYEEDVRTKISNILIEHNRLTGRRITAINPAWEETCSGDTLVNTEIMAEPLYYGRAAI